jgi:uncharacterized membrane protein (UPF0127 family)
VTTRRLAVALAGALVLGACSGGDDEPLSLQRAIDAARPAEAPFGALTETSIRVGERKLQVVLADDGAERTQGLRRRDTLGSYDGMLFVFDGTTSTPFTMSTVPVALDIGFYDRSGRRVAALRMEPCAGAETACPLYSAGVDFRYALETLAGDLPRGGLR